MKQLRVTIWNEFIHEHFDQKVKELYPEGIHGHLKKMLASDDLIIRTAYQEQDDEHGLSEEVLNDTDVLLWWGHIGHEGVEDEVVDRIVERVNGGMGFIALHSAHMSKPFRRLMGTSCRLRWREAEERSIIWNVNTNHPITEGVPLYFELAEEEMYGETFFIPQPEELIFMSWFEGGNVFRSGCTFTRGVGKIFYFQPGHETYPSYYDKNVLRVISNAIRWAAPSAPREFEAGNSMEPLNEIKSKA